MTATFANDRQLSVEPLFGRDVLPLLVTPRSGRPDIMDLAPELVACAGRHLPRWGAVLFRGFGVHGVAALREFSAAFGHALASYDFASTPRTKLEDGVYSSTEYPSDQEIPLHNEQSYTSSWPLKIWFCCLDPGESGGETPLADSRSVYAAMDPWIRDRFRERGLLYVRNYSSRLDVPWQSVFGTGDPADVESYCRRQDIEWQWKPGGGLRTLQRRHAVVRHPRTAEGIWFNQAHLFHISALDAELREGLLAMVGPENLPRNVYYGDGEPIEDSVIDEIRSVFAAQRRAFPWQTGDVLMLDNMLVAHGRMPFRGPRRVIVSMAEIQDGGRFV